MQSLHPKRKFSPEEKQQLLANLDIEVEHRSRQLEAWLTDALENFRNHHEGHPSRIPRIVLGVKMRDLEEKYNGDVQVCVRVLQMDKLVGLGAGVGEERATKKRKWLAEQGTDKESEAEGSRNVKNRELCCPCYLIMLIFRHTAKITTAATPKKKPVSNAAASTLASASRTRVVHKSPGNVSYQQLHRRSLTVVPESYTPPAAFTRAVTKPYERRFQARWRSYCSSSTTSYVTNQSPYYASRTPPPISCNIQPDHSQNTCLSTIKYHTAATQEREYAQHERFPTSQPIRSRRASGRDGGRGGGTRWRKRFGQTEGEEEC